MGRLNTVDDVAHACLWLSTDQAYVTGANIQPNGGLKMLTGNLGKEGTQFDARVIWRDAQDTYSIIGYVRNISDQTIVEGASAGILAGTQLANGTRWLNRNWSVNPPRTYGVEFQYRF